MLSNNIHYTPILSQLQNHILTILDENNDDYDDDYNLLEEICEACANHYETHNLDDYASIHIA